MKERVHIEALENDDFAIKVGDKIIGRLLRTAEWNGYDCILEFESSEPFDDFRVSSLMQGAFIIRNHYEKTFGKQLNL
ncbi:MAG: hypothetical protein EA392_09815 [Cryomorphaceae bacterium]|nr:MAG: hypothetical protein EA392_09815 [Cryomorphaceae bacterium]